MAEAVQNEKPIVADTKIEQENPAKQFESALKQEVNTANTAEAEANRVAREALLHRAEAKSLRDAGIRKVVYGLALTPISMVGGLIGSVVGHRMGEFIGGKLKVNPDLAALAGRSGVGLVGAIGGTELSALAYDHIVRRWDTQARGLDKKDWIFGQLIGNPVMVSGIRDIWSGHQALSGMSRK